MDLRSLGNVYVPTVDGQFVSEKHARIAELISEYDPILSLAWIPPNRRDPRDPPFAIVARPVGGQEYVVCYAEECDERLLARLYGMDEKNGSVMNTVDANNKAMRDLQQKKAQDELADQMEFTQSVLKSKKHTYRHKGVVYD